MSKGIFNAINLNVSISEWIDRINTLVVNLHFFSVVPQENQEEMVFKELKENQEEMAFQEVKALQEVQGRQERMAVQEVQD